MTLKQLRQGAQQGTPKKAIILQFPLPDIAPDKPICLWCKHEFAAVKPNQLYCKPKHRQYACECRKAGLVTAVAALLHRHGASPQRAQDAAADVIEAYYRSGRVQSVVAAMGWTYDNTGKRWRTR